MRSHLLVASLALLAFACSSSDDENKLAITPGQDAGTSPDAAGQEAATGEDASIQPDAALQACPEEVKLSGSGLLPCNCYGNEANETTLADPNVDGIHPGAPACITQVVCCPTIQNLRCEDHEYVDDAGNIIDGAAADAAPDAPIPACDYESDLTKGTLPCSCKGTIVPDPPSALLPDCAKKIVCCPSKGVICE